MERSFTKASGLSLCIGSFLSIVTMVLHPTGGSIDHIIKIQQVLIFSHSLAILSMPFMGFGSWGLSIALQGPGRISMLAFLIFSFGLIAGMIAAAINGLTLPQFLLGYQGEHVDESVLKVVIRYGHYLNVSLAYIFIFATSISVGMWSVLVIRTAQFPKWIGYFGLSLLIFELCCLWARASFTDLYGFRIFVTGLAAWLIIMGMRMRFGIFK